VALSFFAFGVNSETLYCTGKIQYVVLADFQGVYVKPDWHAKKLRICDIDGTHSTAPKDVCNAWLSSIQAGQVSGASVAMGWAPYDDSEMQCGEIPNNSSTAAPKYFYFYAPGVNPNELPL